MATNDTNGPIGHTDQKKLNAHPREGILRAHSDADDTIVPAVTADVDETPAFIRYGAAVLLGLAFGLACYLWEDGTPQAPEAYSGIKPAPTASYFNQAGLYDNSSVRGTLPNPFVSPFEPSLAYYDNSEVLVGGDNGVGAAGTEYVTVNPIGSTLVYLFKYDSTNVPENQELTAMAQYAKSHGMSLDVRAYTDEHGRAVYNQRLSERRAKAIGDYLIAHGVPASKVSVHGMGPTHAFANDAQDRRAEVVVVK